MNDLAQLAQEWLTFSLVLSAQLLLVLALRKPVRAWLGAGACYRLWLLPLLWTPFYLLGPTLFAALASLFAGSAGNSGAAPSAMQQFMQIELLPFTFAVDNSSPFSAGGGYANQKWTLLAAIWAFGTLALILWHSLRWLNFSNHVHAFALPLSDAERRHAGAAQHFAATTPVVRLPCMNSAALFGVLKPVLLLPEHFNERYDTNQRHIILAHEAVHLRRGDNGWNVCALLLMALCWMNPLILLAWRPFRLDQELSCDALALALCNKEQQKRYARTLLESLTSPASFKSQPALSAWNNLGDIKERSLMVKQHLHNATRPVATLLSLLSLAAIGASLTIAFAELVSPVAQAAEPAVAIQSAQPNRPTPRQVTREALQATEQVVRATQQTQATEQALQVTQQELQATEQAVQATQQEVQATEQALQTIQQELQATEQAVQATQQALQEAQQTRVVEQVMQAAGQEQRTAEPQPVLQLAQRASEPVARRGQAPNPPRSLGAQREGDEQADAGTIDEQTGRILTQAIESLNDDQFAEARAHLERLSVGRLSPFERSRYEQLLFNLDMNDENYPGARSHLQAAIDSGGLNEREVSKVRYQMAQLYVQEEKYSEAADALEAWIAAEPAPHAAAYYLLAAAHYYQDQNDVALGFAEKAVELGMSSGVATEAHMSLLGALYTKLGRAADAERVRAEMAAMFPGSAARQTKPNLVPLARVNPDYPRRALQRGLEGWVKVEFTISETGSVIEPIVIDSSMQDVFDNAAIEAVSQWEYSPQLNGGVPVQLAGVQTTFRFRLTDD